MAYGEPFPIPREMTDETALVKIASALDAATAQADAAAGIPPLLT